MNSTLDRPTEKLVNLMVKVGAEDRARLEALAAEQERSLSFLVRRAVRRLLADEKAA